MCISSFHYLSADDDECLLDTYDCPSNYSHCVNILGGFKCECNKGYVQNGSACSKCSHLSDLGVWFQLEFYIYIPHQY